MDYKVYTREFDVIAGGYDCAVQSLQSRRMQHAGAQPHTPEELKSKIAEGLRGPREWVRGHGGLIIADQPLFDADTAVSILFDISSSQRGGGLMRQFAMAQFFLDHAVEFSETRIEMNCFTTRLWKGGNSGEKWRKEASPAEPGRLNDLMIAQLCGFEKTADGDDFKNLAIYSDEGFCRENIDGESLQWAAERLKKQPESNKILLMVSDNDPMDSNTVKKNSADILRTHLDDVCRSIAEEGVIKLEHLYPQPGCIGSRKAPNDILQRYQRIIVSDFEEAEDGLGEEVIRIAEAMAAVAEPYVPADANAFISTKGNRGVYPRAQMTPILS